MLYTLFVLEAIVNRQTIWTEKVSLDIIGKFPPGIQIFVKL